MKAALVCALGGFTASSLVKRRKAERFSARGVDLKYPELSETAADDFIIADLKDANNCGSAVDRRFCEVYQLAADTDGAGYVFTGENDAEIMHNSALINLNMPEACARRNEKRIFYSSAASMYPAQNQQDPLRPVTREDSAYPAAPDSGYGWGKLFSARFYLAFNRNHNCNMECRIARYHSIVGPEGSWDGGKEKMPAALCRKVAEAEDGGESEIGGGGEQNRSFLYIDGCVTATMLSTRSGFEG